MSQRLIATGERGVHRGDGKRFVVCADEKLAAFVELESAINRLPQDEILKPCNAAAL